MPELTAERLRDVLHYNKETGVFTWLVSACNRAKIGNVVGSKQSKGYLKIQIDRRRYLSHRLAWLYVTGEWPKEEIDHIDGIRTNNRFANLREATKSENMRNTRKSKRNSSGLKGVSAYGDRWTAQIRANGKATILGRFDTAEAAHAAYVSAAKKFYGEFAKFS